MPYRDHYCKQSNIHDGAMHCAERELSQCFLCQDYQLGWDKPNYPVPAIPIRVGYQPQDDGWQIYPSAYWFISSKQLCWSFWKKWENMTIDRGRN